MIVKFVYDGSYFVELDGASIMLKSSNPISASATIQVNHFNDVSNGDYFFISTPQKEYYVWFDSVGDNSADPNLSGFASVVVDISAVSTIGEFATVVQTAIDGIQGVTAMVNIDNDIEIDIDEPGPCEPPKDYNTSLGFIDQLKGDNSGGLIKAYTADRNIAKIYDAEYDAESDMLIILCKVMKTILLGKDVGSRTEFKTEARTINNFVWG